MRELEHSNATGARERAQVSPVGSSTARLSRARDRAGDERTGMFSDLPADRQQQMQLIVCASTTPEHALPDVIALLAPGSPGKQAAIVAAINGTDPLREQWERTWRALRR